MNQEIIYFELNNWFSGRDFPDAEPFLSWMRNDLNQRFLDEEWVKKNKLCVVFTHVDMSLNYCITATKEWVLNNCPDLLSNKEYKTKFIRYQNGENKEIEESFNFSQFLRFPDEDGDVYGKFGTEFLEYKEENIGIKYEELDYMDPDDEEFDDEEFDDE